MERLFDRTAEDGRRGYTLEVRVSNEGAIRLYEQLGFKRARHPARLLHGQPRGRADHVERPVFEAAPAGGRVAARGSLA